MERLKSKLLARGFWPGFVIGLFYFGYIFWWLWSLYPLETAGVTSMVAAFLTIFVIFVANVLVSALFWGIWSKFRGRTPFQIAALFVAVEWLRSWSYGLLWYGSGTILGPHWTFGNIAYFFDWLGPLRKGAAVWGIYGIDFVLIFIFASILYAWKNKNFKKLYQPAVLVLVVLAVGLIKDNADGSRIPVAIIQTKHPSQLIYSGEEILSDLREKLKLVNQASGFVKDGGLIVMPEGSGFAQDMTRLIDARSLRQYFQHISAEESLVIENYALEKNNNTTSKTIFISTTKGVIGEYDKRLLSPLGEYRPHWIQGLIGFISPDFKKHMDLLRRFSPGDNSNVITWNENKIKTLVCSDIISSDYGRRGQSNSMVVLNSLGNFHGSMRLESQLISMARYRAVENDKYLVWASNYGRSYIVDNRGKIVARASQNGYQILTEYIVSNKNLTWYTRLGDWPVLILSLLIIGLSLI